MKVVQDRLIVAVCLPSEARVTSGPWMLLRTMSGSMVLSMPGSLLAFMTHIATKDHKDAWGSELPPVVMLVSKGHADLNGLYCHWGNDDIQA